MTKGAGVDFFPVMYSPEYGDWYQIGSAVHLKFSKA